MTELSRSTRIENIRLARMKDYHIIADILGCSKHPTKMRCRKHHSVWVHDRCMVANAIANRMASKILQLEHRITELSHRPAAHELMAAKQEAHREGFLEAMDVIKRIKEPARAWFVLKKYWKDNYGPLKSGSN